MIANAAVLNPPSTTDDAPLFAVLDRSRHVRRFSPATTWDGSATYSQREIMQPGLPWWDEDIATVDAYLARAASYLAEEGVTVSKDVILSDDVATAILDYAARARADLIAIATSGSGGMSRFVFGTVADEVTRKAPASLFVFHPNSSEVTGGTTNRAQTHKVVEA